MTVRNIVVLKKLTSTTGVLQVAQSADTYRLPRDLVFKTGVSTSEVADGSSAVGFKYSTVSYVAAGAKVVQWNNGTTEVGSISLDGWFAPSAGIALTPIAAPAYVEGLLFYDDTDKCPSYYNDEADVTVNLGQENVLRVRNISGSTIADGSVCYISGSTGEFAQIDLAIADTAVPSIIGVATHSIEDTSYGYICTFGIVRGIDTSAFTVGDVLYLSDSVAGGFTTTKPTLPTEAVEVGTVIKVAVAGKIFVSINHVYLHEISDDPTPTLGGNLDCAGNNISNVGSLPPLEKHSDVTITSNTSGELLMWSGAAWINATLAEAGISGGGIANVVDDTTPQLGGNLDVNGKEIQSSTDVVVQLGDNAGVYKQIVQDSDSVDVLSINSEGGISRENSGSTTAPHASSLNLNWFSSAAKSSSGQYSCAIGQNNQASGVSSVALGGPHNISSGVASFTAGQNNVASGIASVAMGDGCDATSHAAVASGYLSQATNFAATGMGAGAKATNRCSFFVGGSATLGAYQAGFVTLAGSTTDATQTTLQAYNTNLVIPADTVWGFSALIAARSDEADGNDSAAYKIEGCLKRDESNNTAIVGSVTVTTIAEDAGAAAWDVTAEADDTNEALAIKVTGEAATNIRWVAKVDISQVSFA